MNMAAVLERREEAMDIYLAHKKRGGPGQINNCGRKERWEPNFKETCTESDEQKQVGELKC